MGFAQMYWVMDDIRKRAIEKAYPLIIKRDPHEVHARNHVRDKLLSPYVAIPGQEIGKGDSDGGMSYSGFDASFKSKTLEKQQEIAARAFFSQFTPLFIMKELLDDILYKHKVGGVLLSEEKINEELYYLVYDKRIGQLKNVRMIRRAKGLIYRSDNYRLKIDHLVYYLLRLGLFQRAKASDTCVMNVKTMTMGSLSNTDSFVPNTAR